MSTTAINRRISPAAHILYYALTALAVVALGTVMGFIGGANRGYGGLVRPQFMPPDITFSIVWPVLYAMMAGTLYFTIITRPTGRDEALCRTVSIALFAVQLAVNVTWPIIFFRMKMMFLAFVWLAVLDAMVLALAIIEFRINEAAAALLIPYLAWIIFATVLNVMMAVYN